MPTQNVQAYYGLWLLETKTLWNRRLNDSLFCHACLLAKIINKHYHWKHIYLLRIRSMDFTVGAFYRRLLLNSSIVLGLSDAEFGIWLKCLSIYFTEAESAVWTYNLASAKVFKKGLKRPEIPCNIRQLDLKNCLSRKQYHARKDKSLSPGCLHANIMNTLNYGQNSTPSVYID